MENKRKKLSEKIQLFLNNYVKKNINNEYVCPDAFCLEKALKLLEDNSISLCEIETPNSEFFNGGYKKEGESLHEEILTLFIKIKNCNCKKCEKIIPYEYKYCPYCREEQ